MAKATCSACGSSVYRGPSSCPEIVCQPCRRGRPSYWPPSSWKAEQRTCPICEVVFLQQRCGQRYCTIRCRNRRARNYTKAGLEQRRQYDRTRSPLVNHRKRARKRNAPSEPYTLAEIAKRDRYHCGICRKRVAMTKVVAHPKAPTIDHRVPLAAGGDDTKANVQLAHYRCNVSKGDRGGGEQLWLIG
jgi:5-methylcytosine-specific restriction endonuclease McrA